MFKSLLLSFITVLMISACGGNDSQSDKTGDTSNQDTDTLQEPLVIDGQVLPPDPGEEGKKTLLGIDSNDNGVRDDVERWIYTTYNEPIERGIFMQSSRAYQKVIVDPGKAKETKKYLDKYVSCVTYWMFKAKENNETFSIEKYRDIEKEINKVQFNSIKRHIAYKKYNGVLSGSVFSLLPSTKDACEFNENGMLEQ